MVTIDALLALFSVNFLLKYDFFLLILLLYLLLSKKQMAFSADAFLLVLLSLALLLFSGWRDQHYRLYYLLPPVAFLIGLNLYECASMESIRKAILWLAAFMALHGVLNLLYETVEHGGLVFGAYHMDVWSRSLSQVTAQMINYSLLAAVFGYCLFARPKGRWRFFLLSAIAVFHTVLCGGRTLLALFLLSSGSAFAFFVQSASKDKTRKILQVAAGAFFLLVLLIVAYQLDFLSLRTTIEQTYLYHRLFSEYAVSTGSSFWETGRWNTKLKYLMEIPQYPFGGGLMRKEIRFYAHDIWLDALDEGGILALLLMTVYTIRLGTRTITLVRRKHIPWQDKMLVFCVTVVFLAQCLVEPVVQGSPVFFCAGCMIDGMIARYLQSGTNCKLETAT